MDQSLLLVKAQLKLQQRHLGEWSALIANQRRVWELVKAETAQKIAVVHEEKRVCIKLKGKQAVRLVKLMERQHEDRQQLIRRQQEEKNSLQQVVENFRSNSN